MALDLILNELSIKSQNSPTDAQAVMRSFISVIASLTSNGVQKVLRTKDDINDTLLAPGYPLRKWRNDDGVSREERTFFKSLTSKSPYMVDSSELSQESLGYSCLYKGQNADGLRASWVLDGICLSFDTDAEWQSPHINAQLEYIDEVNMDILSKDIKISHVSNSEHVQIHKEWIEEKNKLSSLLINDKGICENLEYLVFCRPAIKFITELSQNDPRLKQIIFKLHTINKKMREWNGEFNSEELPFKIRNESGPTLEAYGEERTILGPDNTYKKYSLHFDVNPGACRGYVQFSDPEKKVYVGYLGKHLRIVSQN